MNAKLFECVSQGNLEGLKDMLQKEGLNVNEEKNFDQQTLLIVAAKKGLTEIVQYLIDAGADVNISDHYGFTALGRAIDGGHSEVVRVLLGVKGLNIAATYPIEQNIGYRAIRRNVLHASAIQGYTEIVEMLLDAKLVDKNEVCYGYGETALIKAAEAGHAETVRVLLKHNVDLEKKERTADATALFLAAKKGHAEIVQLLVDAGANVNQKNYAGTTALTEAKERNHTKVIEILEKIGALNGQKKSFQEMMDELDAKYAKKNKSEKIS